MRGAVWMGGMVAAGQAWVTDGLLRYMRGLTFVPAVELGDQEKRQAV